MKNNMMTSALFAASLMSMIACGGSSSKKAAPASPEKPKVTTIAPVETKIEVVAPPAEVETKTDETTPAPAAATFTGELSVTAKTLTAGAAAQDVGSISLKGISDAARVLVSSSVAGPCELSRNLAMQDASSGSLALSASATDAGQCDISLTLKDEVSGQELTFALALTAEAAAAPGKDDKADKDDTDAKDSKSASNGDEGDQSKADKAPAAVQQAAK